MSDQSDGILHNLGGACVRAQNSKPCGLSCTSARQKHVILLSTDGQQRICTPVDCNGASAGKLENRTMCRVYIPPSSQPVLIKAPSFVAYRPVPASEVKKCAALPDKKTLPRSAFFQRGSISTLDFGESSPPPRVGQTKPRQSPPLFLLCSSFYNTLSQI